MDSLKQQLRQYVQDNFILGAGAKAFGDAESFMELHILDSTGFLELIAHLEEAFGIQVLDEEMVPENLDSLDNLASFVSRKRGA